MKKIKNYLQEICSFELIYNRTTGIIIASFIVIIYSSWGLLLTTLNHDFYDSFKIRFLTVFPLACLIYFNIQRILPWLSNRWIILLMSVIVNLDLQYLIVQNHYHEYYLVSFLVVVGLSMGAFNSLSHILIFSLVSFNWIFWSLINNGFIEDRLLLWSGMLLTIILGGFGYFIARMSLLLERKNHLYQLSIQYNELIETQRMVLEKDAQIVNTSRLASLGEMAGGIAHEINNPLAAIYVHVNFLLEGLNEPSFNRENIILKVTKIKEITERITRIVKGLKSFSRTADNDPFESITLKALFEEVFTLCSERFKASEINISIQDYPELCIDCRPIQLIQVLINLLNNSYDAILSLDDKWIKVEFKTLSPSTLQIAITDSGPGISDKVAEKIFQPFFTTKDIGKGTGLGLSISKGILEDHGGKIFIDSTKSNTCFILELPLK